MTIEDIQVLQEKHGLKQTQDLILSGSIWGFEGAMGRNAMDLLECGACFLPEIDTYDYWGNKIPNRNVLKPGTKGTLENSISFWSDEENYLTQFNEEEE